MIYLLIIIPVLVGIFFVWSIIIDLHRKCLSEKIFSDMYYKMYDIEHERHMESLDKIISLEKELYEIRSISELIKDVTVSTVE